MIGNKESAARSEAPKGARKRQLNVIYFVDSARTRSFRMPLGRLNVLLACISVLMVWSMASLFLVGAVVLDRQAVADRLSDTLAILFEYETRYDGVYDIAYPRDSGLPVPPKDPPKRTKGKAVAVAPEDRGSSDPKGDDETASDEDSEELEVESVVSVDSPVIEQEEDELHLRFKILNNNTPIRVGGYVWAVAEYETDSGKTEFIGAPDAIKINEEGEATQPKRAHRFSIRRFSRKNFRFPYPEESGSFTNIRISVMRRDGKGLAVYDVPVDIRISETDDGTMH